MDLSLDRGDLLQLDPISYKGTLKLLPPGKKKKQKLIIGDDSGNLGCYEFKKGEPQNVFLSRPFEGPITNVALGGTTQKRDKLFASHSQRIVGLTKKGKEFFKLTSSLTETILNIVVDDTKIWTGCEYIYNLYDNGHDSAFYMCRHQINSLIIEHITLDQDFDVVLGCQDSCIRIIQGSQLAMEIPVISPVTAVVSMWEAVKARQGSVSIAYGTEGGSFGVVDISDGATRNLWCLHDGIEKSPVNCMKVYDIMGDGTDNVIVGRNDGRMEIYAFNSESMNSDTGAPQLVLTKSVGESIRSIECGAVNSPDHQEVVVAGYSGKVISFTSEQMQQRSQDDKYGRSQNTVHNENRLQYLKKELEVLKQKVDKDKDAIRKKQGSEPPVAPPPDFPVNCNFTLDPELAAYVLTLEIQSSIDFVVIRSPVHLDLVENESPQGVSAVVSVMPLTMLASQLQNQASTTSQHATNPDAGCRFVASFRCQGKERRMVICLRTTEGEAGDMQVTIVTNSTPKAAKVISFPLKPLSLHCKVHSLSDDEMSRPKCRVRFRGSMTIGTIHEWVQAVLPDIPPRLAEDDKECKFLYRNAVTRITTIVEYRNNELVFESDSASAISIVKESVSRMATSRRVQLEEQLTVKEESVRCFLSLIQEKLLHHLSLARKVEIMDAVVEIAQLEAGDTSWLSSEYSDILNNQETIKKDFKDRARALEYLTGIITDLFVDWHRLRGVEARPRIPQLQQVILSADFDALVNQFVKEKK